MGNWGEDPSKYVIYKGWLTNRWYVQVPPNGDVLPDGPGFRTFDDARSFVERLHRFVSRRIQELGG